MRYRTFDEWSKDGYRIYKGEHAVNRRKSDGKPVFSERQVWKRESDDYDYEDDAEQASYYGITPWGS